MSHPLEHSSVAIQDPRLVCVNFLKITQRKVPVFALVKRSNLFDMSLDIIHLVQ